MSTSNQSYKELAIPYFKEVFDIIDSVMKEAGAPFYLIGASAVALQLLQQNIKPARGTKDIDFAVMLSSLHEYNEIVDSLLENGFSKVKDVPHRLYHRQYNTAVDILPFGEIEEDSTVNFIDRDVELHVLGFSEVLETTEPVAIEKTIANLPPLAGMVILKLVAWSDRPEMRQNDLADILWIIDKFFDFNWDEIVEHHNDIFPEDGFDQLLIAAQVLGRKSSPYIASNARLSERILSIIQKNLASASESAIAKEWSRIHGCEVKYAQSILEAFYKGLTEGWNTEAKP